MVKCSCGKTMEKLPDWMTGIQVDFVCNNCPNRQTKNIAFVTFEPIVTPTAKLDGDEPPAELAELDDEE
ncbi:MAG: hypothetical protein ABL949_05865 [Fimbriimonadaceae bacterium]